MDLPAFMDTFRTVAATFNVRRDEDTLGEVYFKALQSFPLRQVQAGGERCTACLKRFPKPVEWKELIPRPGPVGIPELSSLEAREFLEAEACFYECPPCRCEACQRAGVTDQPLRYVPDDDERKARIGEKVIRRGHWAHGDELRRWYVAKETFWTQARAGGLGPRVFDPPSGGRRRRAGFKRLVPVPVPVPAREPGEDG